MERFGRRTGRHHSDIWLTKIEQGSRGMRVGELVALAKVLGVPIEVLLEEPQR